MCAIVVIYEFIIACIFFIVVNTKSIGHIKQYVTTTNPFTYAPTKVYRSFTRKPLENINVDNVLDTFRKTKTETSSLISVVDESNEITTDSSNYENDENSVNNLETELMTLNKAYFKVSDQIKSVHDEMKKNFDIMMKLNILKGMLMEEQIRIKGSKQWNQFISTFLTQKSSSY